MKNVIFITKEKNSAQYRYRCYNIIQVLESSSTWNTVSICRDKYNEMKNPLNKASLIILTRQTIRGGDIMGIINNAHSKGIKVLFDLDDLIFDYRYLYLIRKTVKVKNIFYWLGYFWGIRRIAKRVDGFICTNDFLAEKLKRSFDKPVQVIPNSLNQEQVEVSEKWVEKLDKLDKVKKSVQGDGKFVVGYFSGSPTHTKDFQLVEPELIRFLESHDDLVLKIVGDMKYSRRIQKMIDEGRVEIAKKTDYLRLQGRIAKVDVNIAPLVINDFTNCKSELKFFEAAAVETTTIASPTYTFKKAITDGKNGFLAQPGEWYDKLEYLYQHPEENRKVALAAKKYALKHYYGKEFLKRVEEAYDYFAK